MADTSIIKLSSLEGAKRFDSEYYQPCYLDARNKIENIKSKNISEISKSVLSFGAYSLCNYIVWRESGIPYLKAENIKEGYIDFSDTMYIDRDVHEILKKSEVREGQILLAMSGTIGNAALAYKIPKYLNSNQDIAKITLRRGYSPFYIAAFLNSKYGKLQTQREIVGSVQQHVFLWQIKNFKIPILSRKVTEEIENVYKKGLEQLRSSKILYNKAEELLLKEVDLEGFSLKYKLTYSDQLSNAFEVNRLDAEYFQPAYELMLEKIKKYDNGYSQLLCCLESIKPDFSPRNFPQKIFSYVELSDIDTSIGIINNGSEIIGEEAPSRARRILTENDLIVSSVEGSLEKVALVDKDNQGSLASTGFFQFRTRNILPEVFLVLCKSIILQAQLKRECSGTILTAVPNESLKRILIPNISNKAQEKIGGIVRESHEARKKGINLIELAKKKVEQEIEKTLK